MMNKIILFVLSFVIRNFQIKCSNKIPLLDGLRPRTNVISCRMDDVYACTYQMIR